MTLIDICAYAVMSNHYYLVLIIDDQSAKQLSDREVIERWVRIGSLDRSRGLGGIRPVFFKLFGVYITLTQQAPDV